MKKVGKKSSNKRLFGGNFSCTHPKLYKWLISNLRAFFIGGAISFIVTASATVILHSRQVRYKNDKSVEQAINELYEKADEIKYAEMNKIGCDHCTKLEYLESTGTQYIDTGISSSNNIKIILTFQTLGIKKYQIPLGVNGALNFKIYDNNITFNNGNIIDEFIPNSNNKYIDFECGMDVSSNRYLLYDKKTYYNTVGQESNDKIFIFGLNDNNILYKGSGNSAVEPAPFIGIVYKLEIFLNNILVRDYIPVLDKNNRPCLFDKVGKTCFYNQGTGEFLYG